MLAVSNGDDELNARGDGFASSEAVRGAAHTGVCYSPICGLWCHASESLNRVQVDRLTTIPTIGIAGPAKTASGKTSTVKFG